MKFLVSGVSLNLAYISSIQVERDVNKSCHKSYYFLFILLFSRKVLCLAVVNINRRTCQTGFFPFPSLSRALTYISYETYIYITMWSGK